MNERASERANERTSKRVRACVGAYMHACIHACMYAVHGIAYKDDADRLAKAQCLVNDVLDHYERSTIAGKKQEEAEAER